MFFVRIAYLLLLLLLLRLLRELVFSYCPKLPNFQRGG